MSLLTFDRKRIHFKAFFESQLKYFPLIWIFCSRRANNSINKSHERALRLLFDDDETSFSDLLAMDGSFTVRHTNIQTLLLEMYKMKHKLSESCLKDLFSAANGNYNICSKFGFGDPGINTVFSGANSIRYFGSVIWNSL